MANDTIDISISKEEVAMMPTVKFGGAITLIDNPADVAPAIEYLRQADIVGFDTETKPNFRRGVANKVSLIQVSTDDRSFLFRLNKLGFTPEIKDFLECDDVLKVGLSLKDDFHSLRRVGQFNQANFVELQEMVRRFGIRDSSLRKVYAIIFGERISKAQRLSNWEAPTLTVAQMVYASIDAWACQRIYRTLIAGEFIPEESPFVMYRPGC